MSKRDIIRQTIYICLGAGYGIDHLAVLLQVPVQEVREIADSIK